MAWCDRDALLRQAPDYAGLLMVRWKLALFLPAAAFVTLAGRFTYDDTWDTVTGGGMSALTFLTAPWAVGTAWRALRGEAPRRWLLPAAAACLFSGSWFYDGYVWWRDGWYPETWLPNLVLSPCLYAVAGCMWSLEAGPDGRPTLSFLLPGWPRRPRDPKFSRIALLAAPAVAFAALVLVGSVNWHG